MRGAWQGCGEVRGWGRGLGELDRGVVRGLGGLGRGVVRGSGVGAGVW